MPTGLWLLLCIGVIAAAWVSATRARERVDAITREVCDELRLQRLDESVTLRRIGCKWTPEGLRLQRVFSFEFSTHGADRRRGEVCLLGDRALWVAVDHPDGSILIEIPRNTNATH